MYSHAWTSARTPAGTFSAALPWLTFSSFNIRPIKAAAAGIDKRHLIALADQIGVEFGANLRLMRRLQMPRAILFGQIGKDIQTKTALAIGQGKDLEIGILIIWGHHPIR